MGRGKWSEALHPRGPDGKFTSGGGGGSSRKAGRKKASLAKSERDFAQMLKDFPGVGQDPGVHAAHSRRVGKKKDKISQLERRASVTKRTAPAYTDQHGVRQPAHPQVVVTPAKGKGVTGRVKAVRDTRAALKQARAMTSQRKGGK